MRKLIATLGALTALSAVTMAQAVTYVQSPPLTQVVSTPVGAVAGPPYKMGIITWGGDIATVLCNGGTKATQGNSLCGKQGLALDLFKEDKFPVQLAAYLSGKTPFLRCVLDQCIQASEVAAKDPRTELVVVYDMTRSNGGDVLVAKAGIKTIKDLKGKTIVLQAYGPHTGFLVQLLRDAGLGMKDVNIKWTKDLFDSKETPAEAFRSDPSVDAVFVISPDAAALTSGGTGSGKEGFKGAHVVISTGAASDVVIDLIGVRKDFFDANRAYVQKFVHAQMLSQEALSEIVKNKAAKPAAYKQAFTSAAEIILGAKQAVADAEGLYGDAKFSGYQGNVEFFTNKNDPRNFSRVLSEYQASFMTLGLIGRAAPVVAAGWDYAALRAGAAPVAQAAISAQAESERTAAVARLQSQGKLDNSPLPTFIIPFQKNKADFPAEAYGAQFERITELVRTYGGAVVTIQAHVDPLKYVEAVERGEPEIVLKKLRTAADTLSQNRADALQSAIIAYAKGRGVNLSPGNFASVGQGFQKPVTGMCGAYPCKPKSEGERQKNMRAEFRVTPIEVE
jgi:hypothetical protein